MTMTLMMMMMMIWHGGGYVEYGIKRRWGKRLPLMMVIVHGDGGDHEKISCCSDECCYQYEVRHPSGGCTEPRFRAYSSPSLSCWLGLKAFTLTPDSESAPKAKQTSNGPLFD